LPVPSKPRRVRGFFVGAVLSEFGATKVEHNMVRAAEAAPLSGDEAVPLWNMLLSGLKFRVNT
jgi:hypothetical protein